MHLFWYDETACIYTPAGNLTLDTFWWRTLREGGGTAVGVRWNAVVALADVVVVVVGCCCCVGAAATQTSGRGRERERAEETSARSVWWTRQVIMRIYNAHPPTHTLSLSFICAERKKKKLERVYKEARNSLFILL